MITDEINELKNKYICLSHKSSEEDFKKLWEISITDKYTIPERNNNILALAEIFWILCINFQGNPQEFKDVKQLKNFINYITGSISSVKQEFYKNKEFVFIDFLHFLLHREDTYLQCSSENFMEFYSKIYDVIEKMKWLFSLEEVEEEKKIFPIRSLLMDVANTFRLDQEHYLQLVFSLEIFKCADLEKCDKDKIKHKMLKLAKDYNIKLIELLCDDGKVLYERNASLNSALNSTIIVRTKNKVLIRNTSKNYFMVDNSLLSCYHGIDGYEGKNKQNPIAFYYEYDIKDDESLEDLKYIFCNCPNKTRCEVMKYILKEENYNVFLGKCFWVNQDSKEFSRALNPFGIKDDEVVISESRTTSGNNKFEKFINVIMNQYDEFGVLTIAKRGEIDVLSLDFLVLFYKELVKEGNDYIEKMIEMSNHDNDYYQNILFKIYFEEAFKNGKILDALNKYTLFINKYFDFENVNQKTKFIQYKKLVMPFRPYILCDGNITNFYIKLQKYEYIVNTKVKKLTIEKSGRTRKKYLIDNIEIDPQNILDFTFVQIDESDIKSGDCLFDNVNNIVYILNKNSNVENKLKKIKEISEVGILVENWEKNHTRFDEIHCISRNIGFSDYEKNFGRRIFECKEEAADNISLYKLLWHIQFWELENQRYRMFSELVLERYYTEFVKNPSEYVKQFFDDLMKDSDEGKLIIAKESDGEGSTLKQLFDTYNDGGRGPLRKAFDGAQIEANYEKKGGKHYYLGKEITDIVFITDNILSGKSTLDMLKFYINNYKEPHDLRTYLWNQSIIIPELLKDNPSLNIEIKSILCTDRGRKRILNQFKNINISSILNLSDNVYNWTKLVEDKVIELYEINPNPDRREDIQCVFRPCNMPSEHILPDSVKDVSKLIGIFQRKGEI